MHERNNNFRRRVALTVAALAVLLAGYATYLLTVLPTGHHFPVSWSRSGKIRTVEMGVWGLYLIPVLLAVGASYLWRSKAWLLSEKSRDRRFTLILIGMLIIGFVMGQLILFQAATAADSIT